MPREEFYRELEEEWSYDENPELYIGFSSAAVPETLNQTADYVGLDLPIWDVMTDYGLDKVSHFGFSFFGGLAVWKASETVPEAAVELTEDHENPVSGAVNAAGRKAMDPSFRYKAGLTFGAVAAAGGAKESTDAFISYLDMTANMLGASAVTLKMYGDGDLLEGVELALEDVRNMLEDDPAPRTDGGRPEELEQEVMEKMEALGKA